MIRKGQINLVQRDVMEGTAFVVLDETMAPFSASRCTLTLGGVEHTPNASGVIVVPPSPPGSTPPKSALVTVAESDEPGAWTMSALESVELVRDAFTLDASFFVDRDALVEGNGQASLLVRAQLRNAAGIQVPVSRVEGATLALRTRDSEGTVSTVPEAPVELSDDEDVVHVFRVPADLRHLEAKLSGRVRLSSTAKTEVHTHRAADAAWPGALTRRAPRADADSLLLHLAQRPAVGLRLGLPLSSPRRVWLPRRAPGQGRGGVWR